MHTYWCNPRIGPWPLYSKSGGNSVCKPSGFNTHAFKGDRYPQYNDDGFHLPGRLSGIPDRLLGGKQGGICDLGPRRLFLISEESQNGDLSASINTAVVEAYATLDSRDRSSLSFCDALSCNWDQIAWVFPPSLIPRVLAHFNKRG